MQKCGLENILLEYVSVYDAQDFGLMKNSSV